MPIVAQRPSKIQDLPELARAAADGLDALLADAVAKVRERISAKGKPAGQGADRDQRATHGLAWLATYVEAVRQLASYAERMARDGSLGETEELLVRIGLGEYTAQVAGGIPMSQGEIVRLSDLGISPAQVATRIGALVERLLDEGNTADRRSRLVELMRHAHSATIGECGLDDTLGSI